MGSTAAGQRRFLFVKIWAAASLAASGATPAVAYKIHPKKAVHEAITLASLVCLRDAQGARPVDCLRYSPRIADLVDKNKTGVREFGELEIASRWPDDPTREIGAVSLVKFIVTAGWWCNHVVKLQRRLDSAGLRCSSHYGRLQFFHAMSSSRTETRDVTRSKMLAWADFSYKMARGDIARGDVNPEEDYCGYFDRTATPKELKEALRPDGFALCAEKWNIGRIFAWSCRNPFSSGKCRVISGFGSEFAIRRAATGAILHMIQDSYSESHTKRFADSRGPKGPFGTRMSCDLPQAFFFYNDQSATTHGEADMRLDSPGDRCPAGSTGDDVITASATALWLLEKKADPRLLQRYLACRVIGYTEGSPGYPGSPPACEKLDRDLASAGGAA